MQFIGFVIMRYINYTTDSDNDIENSHTDMLI